MKQDVVAVILAAGIGKRFWPFTTDKILFPFMGKKFIEYTVAESLPKEVSKVVFVANSGNAKILKSVELPVPTAIVLQNENDGMAGAVRAAAAHLHGKQVLIVLADDLSDKNVLRTVMERAGQRNFGVIPAWHATSYFPGGYIAYQGQRPVGIVEKPPKGKEPSSYVDFGGQYIEDADALLAALDAVKSDKDDVYEHAITSLMKSHEFVVAPFEEKFVSLKYPWHVLDVMMYLLEHRFSAHKGKKVEIRNNVSIEGPVYIGDNVRIFENTKIVGPVYIGDNTIIGNNNIIRESYIGPDCVTGFNTDIARSYVGDHCWFHSNYVGDSVLEGNISMGSGSVLANLRLDEGEIPSVIKDARINTGRSKLGAMIGRNVRIGVNTNIMPGIKIGSDSLIGAGLVVDKDIPSGSFCVAKPNGYEIKKNAKKIESHGREEFKSKI